MIKANTTVVVAGKTYQEGQTVTGLSATDKAWMEKAGYITETKTKKAEEPKAETKAEEVTADAGQL
jgi:hypothetical protein